MTMGFRNFFRTINTSNAEADVKEDINALHVILKMKPFLGEPDSYVDGEPAWLGSTWKKAAYIQMRFQHFGPFICDPDFKN